MSDTTRTPAERRAFEKIEAERHAQAQWLGIDSHGQDLTTFHEGDRVVYVPFPGGPREHGTVKSVYEDGSNVFVRYDGAIYGKLTPCDLLEEAFPCGHEERTRGCGGCDPGAGWTFNEDGVTVATPTSAPDMLCLVGEMNGKPHDPHDWWYTSSGGGHQMDRDPGEDSPERNVKAWRCPGIEATS